MYFLHSRETEQFDPIVLAARGKLSFPTDLDDGAATSEK
jgi:hypothetical protein